MTACPPPPPLPGRRKKRRHPKLVVIGFVAAVVCIIGVKVFYRVYRRRAFLNAFFSNDERFIPLKVSDLPGWVDGLEYNPKYEKVNERRNPDGTYNLKYDYEPPLEKGPSINFLVRFEKHILVAKLMCSVSFKGTMGGLIGGFGDSASFEKRKDFIKWGDKTNFRIVKWNGETIGIVFTAYKGKTVVSLLMTKRHFDCEVAKNFLLRVFDHLDGNK